MEAFGAVVHRPMAVSSAGVTESVCQRRSMRIEVSKKLSWSGGLSSSCFSDKGHLVYYDFDRSRNFGCRKVFAGAKTEKKMKKKDIEGKEKKKKNLKMPKGLSRDLLMFSKTGLGLDSNLEVQTEMISDAVMQLQGQMQQLLTRENELRNNDIKMVSSCFSESSDSETNFEASNVLLQGQIQQLRIKEKEVKQKKKEERRRSKKLNCGMESSSSSESSDSECEKLANMNKSNCLLLPAEKLSSNESQEIVPETSSMLQRIELLEDNLSSKGCTFDVPKNSSQDPKIDSKIPARVEVCMGGKCKKSGAVALMEEFQRLMGIEGDVSGCKCMGKCKNGGPNVRVYKSDVSGIVSEPPRSVGLGDVGSIVANILGESGLPSPGGSVVKSTC